MMGRSMTMKMIAVGLGMVLALSEMARQRATHLR